MSDRQAISTLKGYFYQFDKQILEILKSDNTEKVTIEGIEDVDISTASTISAIQCKYHEDKEYNHSSIKKPIKLMLQEYCKFQGRESSHQLTFHLYAHFDKGQDKLSLPLAVDFLKEHFLTTSSREGGIEELHKDLGLTDQELESFLNVLSIDLDAPKFDIQYQEVIHLIEKQFRCTKEVAESLYYPNALHLIRNLSVNDDVTQRIVCRADFVQKVEAEQCVYDHWYRKYQGQRQYLARIKKQHFTRTNISPFNRFFIFEKELFQIVEEAADVIIKLCKNWSKISRRERSRFCPYVYIDGQEEQKIAELKEYLKKSNFVIEDGYDFKNAVFDYDSIFKMPRAEETTVKIIDSNDVFEQMLATSRQTCEIYSFYIENKRQAYRGHKQVDVYVESISEIKEVI